ncbi:MAG: hypothetical protein JO204_22725 [Alphaproteobacteria bacterium]|nr:hypothetical protein [Alphaproteobacteria bacterium]
MRTFLLKASRPLSVVPTLIRDRRGATAVLLALALSGIIGFAGLGSEVASWYFTTRAMQSATDTAASSAAASLASAEASAGTTQCPTSGNFCQDVARSIAASFNFADSTNNTTVTVNNPPANTTNLPTCSSPFTTYNCYVEVLINQPQPALISALFMSSGPTITTRAVAKANIQASDDGCVVALGTAPKAIDISTIGSPALTLSNCALYDNSPDTPGALTLGGSATITAKAAYIAGSVSGSGLTTTDGTFTGVNPISDPYADRSFSWPSPKPVASSNTNCDPTVTSGTIQPSAAKNYVYVICGGLKVVGNNTLNLCPGTYIIDQGTLDLNSGTLNAPPTASTTPAMSSALCPGNTTGGVTIVLANDVSGSAPADIKMAGNFTTNITAPTTGSLAGIAIFQDRVACTSCSNSLVGGGSQNITGVVYFPDSAITYGGNNSTSGPVCTKLVANTISFKGSSTFNSNCTSTGTGTINYVNGTLVM